MARTETLTFGDKKFTARVLSMREIRDIVKEVESPDYRKDLIDNMFEDGLPSPAFYCALDCTEDDIVELKDPEQVKELMEAVAKINPIYAGMERRMSAKVASFEDLEKLEVLQQSLKQIAST